MRCTTAEHHGLMEHSKRQRAHDAASVMVNQMNQLARGIYITLRKGIPDAKLNPDDIRGALDREQLAVLELVMEKVLSEKEREAIEKEISQKSQEAPSPPTATRRPRRR